MFSYEGYTGNGTGHGPISRLRFRLKKRRQLQREQALARRGWYDPAARSDHPAIFIGGCGRSGTTLLRELLDRHPRLACGPETSIFGLPFQVDNQANAWSLQAEDLQQLADSSENIVAYADAFFQKYLLQPTGKPRWADKTPNNVRVLAKLLTWYPQGRFIHVIRDGRDVVCSLRHHPRERIVDGQRVPVETNNPISKWAMRWLKDTSAGLAFRGHPRYFEVRYEDLVQNTEQTLREVCDFIGEPYDPVMLQMPGKDQVDMASGRLMNNANAVQAISTKSIGRWKRDLSRKERDAVVDVAGELLIVAGYVENNAWTVAENGSLEKLPLCQGAG